MFSPTYVGIGLAIWHDLTSHLAGMETISIALGPDAALYVLALVPPVDYILHRTNASFPKIKPDKPNTFVILRCDDYSVTRTEIGNQLWNYHFVQPLPDDELLLVCARSRYYGRDQFDLNASVFNVAGELQREFLLGDGIEHVQTTRDGRIWAGYFDEGVVGNFGWKSPVGNSGLVCWDRWGEKIYGYRRSGDLKGILDCYALNVANERDTWCCYYTDFPIVHLRDYQIVQSWNSPIRGSKGFLFYRHVLLMHGGYDEPDLFHLLKLRDNGEVREIGKHKFFDPFMEPLLDAVMAIRDDTLVFLRGTQCYRFSLADALQADPSDLTVSGNA